MSFFPCHQTSFAKAWRCSLQCSVLQDETHPTEDEDLCIFCNETALWGLTWAQRGRPPSVKARLGLHSSDSGDHSPTWHHRTVLFYLCSRNRSGPGLRLTRFYVRKLWQR